MSDKKPGWLGAMLAPRMSELSQEIAKMEREYRTLLAALDDIAAWNDKCANQRLVETGSFGAFDEPAAVKTAREALSKVKP